MREIKFRAWHKNNNHMCQNVTTDLLDRDYLIFMQYTGLKDRNGKEIYEGDIVQHPQGGNYHIAWRNDVSAFVVMDGIFECVNMGYINLYEVVGNIYENPEKIKKSISQ